MKLAPLLLFLIACWITSHSQTHSETFTACDKSYNITCELKAANKIKLTFVDGLNDSVKAVDSVTTTDMDQFAKSFRYFFLKFIGTADSGACPIHDRDTTLLVYGRKLYLSFLAANTEDSNTPTAGLFSVKDSAIVRVMLKFIYNKTLQPTTDNPYGNLKYKIEKVSAEINNGFIENIKAYIQMADGLHYFSIPYPVGISSVGNFKQYHSRRLFDEQSPAYIRKISEKEVSRQVALHPTANVIRLDSAFYILLSDIIDYDYYFGVDRRDYSPKNDTLVLLGGESRILHKESTDRLFEAHIFTDFVGLNEDKPNGLIQTEISKRINVNSLQYIAPNCIYWLAKSLGGLQYISPSITLSKIEQHNRRFILGDLDSVRFNPNLNDTSAYNHNQHRYVTAIDLYQYQSFSAGGDINIFYLNNHELKYNISLNFGARVGITPVRDSLTTITQNKIAKTGFVSDYSINFIEMCPQAIITFLPEERFNLSLSGQFMYIKPLNSLVQLVSTGKNDNTKLVPVKSSWLNTLEMLMTIQVNPTSKLFGRIRLNSAVDNHQDNFAQIQVGYSTYILGNK
jgi:hypothetical protein